MTHYDLVIIGFGKAGKTLAKFAASEGKAVAMIEKDQKMYGGTCINVGCIPSKTLIHDSLEGSSFASAFDRKREVVDALNNKNYHMLADTPGIDVINATAQFKSNKEIVLLDEAGQELDVLTAEDILINTGSTPVIPNIEGIGDSKHLYDSAGIMDLPFKPEHLVIVGAGYIALEFASLFARFGVKVTMFVHHDTLLPKEDREIVELIEEDLIQDGVNIVYNVETQRFEDQERSTIVHTSQGEFEADAVLLATGRHPITSDLGLDHTDIEVGKRGEIEVNEHLQTAVPNIYAAGDVTGGLQFTYISLDDFRIIKDNIFGEGKRTTENRGVVPYSMFINPPFSRVGMTKDEAQAAGYEVHETNLAVKNIPRHKVNNDARGMLKAVIDAKSGLVLGATLYCRNSEEIINLVKLAIDQNIPAEVLANNIYTHPTMAEAFNNIFQV